MKTALLFVVLVNTLLFILLTDKIVHRMYWYTITRPDVYTYLTPYGYMFSFILDILVSIGVFFYTLIIAITVGTSYFCYNASVKYQVAFLIKHPFCIPKIQGRCYHVSNALYKNGYIYHYINSKLYWDALFKSCNIKTPKIYGVIKEGEISTFQDLRNSKVPLIVKPVKLYSANGIAMFDIDSIPATGHYIIQEYIKSFNDLPHSFRIVTIRKNSKAEHWQTTLSINSNHEALTTSVGGKTVTDYEVKEGKARNVLRDEWVPHNLNKKHLKAAIQASIILHENMKYYIQSVGWDFIMAKDGPYFLEGNMCHGIVRKRDYYYYEHMTDFIAKAY